MYIQLLLDNIRNNVYMMRRKYDIINKDITVLFKLQTFGRIKVVMSQYKLA